MTDLPKTAHELLAEAVRTLLDNIDPSKTAAYVEHLEMSLRNYDIALGAAKAAPFQGIVNGALAQLEAGETEAAKKFLQTLLGVIDFTPNIALAEVVKAPAKDEFKPTHRHVNGGPFGYEFLDEGWFRDDGSNQWVHTAFYRSDDLVMRGTTMLRWTQDFYLIEAPTDAV